MTRTRLEYFPANGGAEILFTTGPDAAYRLVSLDGIGPMELNPQSIKSPGQTGETAVDVIVPPRVVVVQSLIQAPTPAALWPLRAALSRALVIQPTRLGEEIETGRLRLTLPDSPPLELDVIPRSAAMPRGKSGIIGTADIEFFAAYPYWREADDSLLVFETSGGGFEWGLEFSLEMESNNVQQEVDNQGDVDAPTLIRIFGDCTVARLLNLTTGETIEITGQIEADEYVEIVTGFGEKAVTLVNTVTDARISIMDRLNLALADFWHLRPGLNTVRFEADVNVSGRAEFFWRQRYSGV